MCTVTVVPHQTGIRMTCNRDERRTRPAAIPPRVYTLGGRLAAFPVDPLGGGSWVGVNDAGIAVALLNVHRAQRRRVRRPTRSRGLIVRELLGCGCMSEVLSAIERLEREAFDPFQLVIVRGSEATIATSDGDRALARRQVPLDAPLLFTSSSLGDALVGAPRRMLFKRMVVYGANGWLEGQARFHRHQWPLRPEISVRMEREDALTVSRTIVDMSHARRVVLYEAPLREQPSREGRVCCTLH